MTRCVSGVPSVRKDPVVMMRRNIA
jgi:hypothetical protein